MGKRKKLENKLIKSINDLIEYNFKNFVSRKEPTKRYKETYNLIADTISSNTGKIIVLDLQDKWEKNVIG